MNNKADIKIPFNKPFFSGKEIEYISQILRDGHISGNGIFTKKCQQFFEDKYHFTKCLLTTSCTDALEMCALLLEIQPGDEVIMPSFTFVSTANAFVLRGAKIIFADSKRDEPNMDPELIESLITSKTKAIVVVHYAGVACDMDMIMQIANRHHLFVVEDAAQAIDSFYKNKPLGGIGHLSAFSFHETKNVMSGEGGMLAVNDKRFLKRAEILWEKGTNRSAFFRGEVDKYNWVDVGSSFLMSDMLAAFLYAQLESLEIIQRKRLLLWNCYYDVLKILQDQGKIQLPFIPDYATNNAHMFYLVCKNSEERTKLIVRLRENNILAIFHYLSLHKSPFYSGKHDGRVLTHADRYTDCLMRLPMYYDLEPEFIQERICDVILQFYSEN